jgi:hypothetical protein
MQPSPCFSTFMQQQYCWTRLYEQTAHIISRTASALYRCSAGQTIKEGVSFDILCDTVWYDKIHGMVWYDRIWYGIWYDIWYVICYDKIYGMIS